MTKFDRRSLLKVAGASVVLSACGEPEMPHMAPPKAPARPPQTKRPNPIYTRRPPASPIHLSDSLVLRSGAQGGVAPAAMKNPMGQDMEILEIKFELSGQSATAVGAYGSTIWCDLSMGGIKLTNGAIPVSCFGRVENLRQETSLQDLTDGTAFALYSWRLPRPLFVPAGAAVLPNFTHTGFTTNTINVRVGYSARTVFRKPKTWNVPWVAKYISKAFNPIQTAGTDVSSELDLVNPNPEPLHLQRFMGRSFFLLADGSSGEEFSKPFTEQYLTMRMVDSYGRPLVGNFVPYRAVFSGLTRSWELDNGTMLDPEAYYIINLKSSAMSLAAMQLTDASVQAVVSMVGWRELENP